MSDYIVRLTEQEFKEQTSYSKSDSFVIFNDVFFQKRITFSATNKELAVKYCQRIIDKKLTSLLIESQYCLTVWVQEQTIDWNQKQDIDFPKIDINCNFTKGEQKTLKTLRQYRGKTYEAKISNTDFIKNSSENNIDDPIPSKTIIRQYRGQTYEVKVPDYSVIKQTALKRKKSLLKYRGQNVD